MPQENPNVSSTLVYIPGVWDVLHYGHVNVLRMAGQLGTRLVVGVPSDDTVMADKGIAPVCSLFERMAMLMAIRYVDAVMPYHELRFIEHLEFVNPDILAVGETWGSDTRHQEAEAWVRDHNKLLVKLPYTSGISTTDLIARTRTR